MCSTNHHLTCKTVFLHNSPLAPNINYTSYGDKTCVKLRQCVQLTCLDIKPIVGLVKLQNIEDSSFIIIGYQMLLLAMNKLMGDNKKFDNSAIF